MIHGHKSKFIIIVARNKQKYENSAQQKKQVTYVDLQKTHRSVKLAIQWIPK